MTDNPVFVYGALRSGTTVFRLMLNAHPALDNPGEVDFLFDHLHRDRGVPGGWSYDRAALADDRIFRSQEIALPDGVNGLDLLRHMIGVLDSRSQGLLTLNMHRHASVIAETLPEARFIHLLRDPRDVARSAIRMGWVGNSYFGADHWEATETDWDQAAISDTRALTVRFEALMSGLEVELGRVCDFLGVPFDPEMLSYHENTTYTPPDPAIIQHWRRKASAHEIALIEGRIGALMEARGYTRNGPPHVPGRSERLTLLIGNRLKRWRFNIRRYGLPLYTATHAARLVGARSLHRQLRLRQEEITVRHLQ